MKTFKSKSLISCISDSDIENKCYGTRFISFEAAIRMFQTEFNIKDKPIGYRITEQGIEIAYE